MKLDLSPESKGRVILTTVLGTAVCMAAAVYVASLVVLVVLAVWRFASPPY